MWTSFHPLPGGIENNTYISFIGIYQCQRPDWLVLVKVSHLVPYLQSGLPHGSPQLSAIISGFMQRLHCISLHFLRVVLTCDNPPDIWYCFWFTILAKGLAIAIMMSITLQSRDLLGKLYCSYKYPTQLYLQWLGLWQQDESLELLDLLWCGWAKTLFISCLCMFFFITDESWWHFTSLGVITQIKYIAVFKRTS